MRIDHKFNDKWTILGHFMEDQVTQGYAQPELGWLSRPSYNTVTSTLANPSDSAAIKLSGTINPNLLVEASINYDGNVINIIKLKLANLPSGWGVNTFFNTGNPYLPGVTGFGGPYDTNEDIGSAPWHNAARDYEPKVDISYTSGKHAMKFGFSYNRYTKNQQLFGDAEGDFGFGQLSNDGLMDFLMGLASSYSQYQATPIRHYVNQTPSVYAMDNWHVTPRLTLQLGLRYDALPHAWERNNAVANFDPTLYLSSQTPEWNSDGSLNPKGPGFQSFGGVPFYVNGMGLAGQNGFPRGLVTNDYNTLQPRVGFSEDLFGNGKTVLRGGFGIFFERMQGNDIYNAATAPPFAFNPSASNVYVSTPSTSWVTGQTAATPFFATGLTNLASTYKAPAVAQFSFGIQHELRPSMIWVVQYVGNIAWHQNINRYINNMPITEDMTVRCDSGDGSNKYAGDTCPASTLTGAAINANQAPPNAAGGAPVNLANANIYRTFAGYAGITPGRKHHQRQLQRIPDWSASPEQVGSEWRTRLHLLARNRHHHLRPGQHQQSLQPEVRQGFRCAGSPSDAQRQLRLQTALLRQPPGIGQVRPRRLGTGRNHHRRDRLELGGQPLRDRACPSTMIRSVWMRTVRLQQSSECERSSNLSEDAAELVQHRVFSAPIPAWLGGPNQGFGSARKDAVIGPGRVNFTTSLYKSFAITERAHFELRFESFNTFNHTEFNNFNDSFGSSQFGQITSAWDPRNLELGGKFVF